MSKQGEKKTKKTKRQPIPLSHDAYNVAIGSAMVWGFGLGAIVCALTDGLVRSVGWGFFLLILVVYGLVAIGGISLGTASDDPRKSFIGFSLVLIPFASVLNMALQGVKYLSIVHVAGDTAVIVAILLFLALFRPGVFKHTATIILATVIAAIIVEALVWLFYYRSEGESWLDWVFIMSHSVYVAYCWSSAQGVEKPTLDDAMDACIQIYKDVIMGIKETFSSKKEKDEDDSTK